MTSFLIWFGAGVAMFIGPMRLDHHTVRHAELACRCQCGIVYGEREDLPVPEPDENWSGTSHWFGDHTRVCFLGPIPDVKARLHKLQLATDMAWNRRIYPAHTSPGLIPRNGVY